MSSANLKFFFVAFLFSSICQLGNAQNFLSTSGKSIVNENQQEILLRGMGLGGWMVQEGYMLQTAGFANPQHEIRATIEALIGEEDTELFYEAWLENHVTKSDIDSLKSWGFNSVRLPMHYNLFTLPIEDEPIFGEDTWLDKGFELTDSLVSWCKANEMYVILDMHAAPGGQGYDEAISDYDPSKPSLWESTENRRKLTALWKRIAEHYADEEWIAGYDLLYQNLTEVIREVDDRHILFIEGNWFANDFTGLTPPWDDNLVYSPHKYWSLNDEATMKWVTDMRNLYNVPLYLGESGENSNVWFRDAIALLEGLDIGWAWWPMKKIESVAGPMSVIKSEGYQSLLDYWSGNGNMPSAENAKEILMDLTEKLKAENCVYQKDVIDAMFRQVYSDETKPFKKHKIPGIIYATDYDLGVIGEAYYDTQSANYQVSTGEYTSWNDGWQYRNDGVDIEKSNNDVNSNGFNVGFMDVDEWMQYEVDVEESGVYEIHLRTSSGASGGIFHFSIDGGDVLSRTFTSPTGAWQNWQTVAVSDVILYEGMQKLRFHTDAAGFNLASFEFIKTEQNIEDLESIFVSAETYDNKTIQVNINKSLNPMLTSDGLEVRVNGAEIEIIDAQVDATNLRLLKIEINDIMNSTDVIKLSYEGTNIIAEDQSPLVAFTLKDVNNTLDFVHQLPGKIEAEDYTTQSGIQLENSTDSGGGENIGYLDPNDFLDYDINVEVGGQYQIDYRTAAEFGTGGLRLILIDDSGEETIIDASTFASTGGWQSWITTSTTATIPQGRYTMRLLVTQAPFNLNWIDFDLITGVDELNNSSVDISIWPNPTTDQLQLKVTLEESQDVAINVFDALGKLVFQQQLTNVFMIEEVISTTDLADGLYILNIQSQNHQLQSKKFIKTSSSGSSFFISKPQLQSMQKIS